MSGRYNWFEVSEMKKLLILILSLVLLSGCTTTKDKYYTIDHFYIKEEGDAFYQAYDELVVDIYNWYQSIEDNEDVYIIHYDHYPIELMKEWKATGYMKNIPLNDLDYYVASVNYLEERGIVFTDSDRQAIMDGTRYYLLPEGLDEEEKEALKLFLTEDALQGLDGDTLIDTTFRQNRKIEFLTYEINGTFEIPGGEEIKEPVIYAASCSSMKFFEAESLAATGVNDGYIRLSEEAYRKYAKNDLPQELKDKGVTFLGLSKVRN